MNLYSMIKELEVLLSFIYDIYYTLEDGTLIIITVIIALDTNLPL